MWTCIKSFFLSFFKGRSKHKLLDNSLKEIEEKLMNNNFGLSFVNSIMTKITKCTSIEEIKIELKKQFIEIIENKFINFESFCDTFDNNFTKVILLIGNNGVGKTSLVGKMAYRLKSNNKDLKIATSSLDFFRAGAFLQLEKVANHYHIDFISHVHKKSAAHTFYLCENVLPKKYDYLLLDMAGRIHTDDNLLDEIITINDTLKKFNAHKEIILVVDGNFGSVVFSSIEYFSRKLEIKYLVITKTDTTPAMGWIIRLLKEKPNIKILGEVTGEKENAFIDFKVENYIDNLVEVICKN